VSDAHCLCEKSQKPEIRSDSLQLGAVTNRAALLEAIVLPSVLPTILPTVLLTRLAIICTAPLNNGVGETWSHANGICLARVGYRNERAGDEHRKQQLVHFDSSE